MKLGRPFKRLFYSSSKEMIGDGCGNEGRNDIKYVLTV